MKKRFVVWAVWVFLASIVLIASLAGWFLYSFLQSGGLLKLISNPGLRFGAVVVDQNDDPMPDVKVTFSISPYEPTSPYIHGSFVTTNSDGAFKIADGIATQLEIKTFEKPGYVFWCWDNLGPNNRTTFHLLKQAGTGKPSRAPLPNTYQSLPYYMSTNSQGP
jgi:hypothetical protein